MADLTITAANMIPVSGFSFEQTLLSGAAITIGQSVYLDTTTSTWKLADANGSAATAGSGGVGVALTSAAAAAQPITVMTGGSLAFGAILTVGILYCVSATAGGICPYADLTTGDRVTVLGVASTTSNLVMQRWVTGVTKP